MSTMGSRCSSAIRSFNVAHQKFRMRRVLGSLYTPELGAKLDLRRPRPGSVGSRSGGSAAAVAGVGTLVILKIGRAIDRARFKRRRPSVAQGFLQETKR